MKEVLRSLCFAAETGGMVCNLIEHNLVATQDLLVSVKQLAMERVRSTREKSLNGLLTPAGLRTIGRVYHFLISYAYFSVLIPDCN